MVGDGNVETNQPLALTLESAIQKSRMNQKFVLKVAFACIVVACILVGLGIWFYVHPSQAAQIRRLLGVSLPNDATDVRCYYQKPWDYQWVVLYLRCKVPRESADRFVLELGLVKVGSESGNVLGKLGRNSANTGPDLTWWNPPPPENQNVRWVRKPLGDMICVWNDGYLYLYKHGTVGR